MLLDGDFASWQRCFSPFKDIKNIEFRQGNVPYEGSIVLDTFRWRKNSVVNFQESPLMLLTSNPDLQNLSRRQCQYFTQ